MFQDILDRTRSCFVPSGSVSVTVKLKKTRHFICFLYLSVSVQTSSSCRSQFTLIDYGCSVGALSAELGQVASAALAVFLADKAQPAGTVEVVEAPIMSQVGTVLISRTQTVLCPAVRLTGSPVSGSAEHKQADTRTALPVTDSVFPH